MLKNYLRKKKLKKQEKVWQLYNEVPEFDTELRFAFIDQLSVCGHYNCPIAWNYEKYVCNSVIVINLNKRVDEDVIISSINHEYLHTAITHCLRNPSQNNFIETVIENWLLEEKLQCNTWEGTVKVQKKSG